jgi:hypothetical protein
MGRCLGLGPEGIRHRAGNTIDIAVIQPGDADAIRTHQTDGAILAKATRLGRAQPSVAEHAALLMK